MQRLNSFFQNLFEKIKESELFQQLKSQYDELDAKTKGYVNTGAIVALFGLLVVPIFWGLVKVSSMKSDINEKEELIGFLDQSNDQVKHLRALQEAARGDGDTASPLNMFAERVLQNHAGLVPEKYELGALKNGYMDKSVQESLLEIKLKHVSIRNVVRSLFAMVSQGHGRKLNIKDLSIDTKSDPEGYMDASFVISQFKPKE